MADNKNNQPDDFKNKKDFSKQDELSVDRSFYLDNDIAGPDNAPEPSADEPPRDISGAAQGEALNNENGEQGKKSSRKKKQGRISKFLDKHIYSKVSPKNRKRVKRVLILLAVILLIGIVTIAIYIGSKLGLIQTNHTYQSVTSIDPDDNDIDGKMYHVPSAEDVESLDQMLREFYMSGQPMYSKYVYNILLIGRDTTSDKSNGRADAIILLSLNKRTKEIKMVSFWRDTYAYIPTKSGTCEKINGAHAYGGPDMLVETIENNFKISIDKYVSLNFESFKDVIDELGGVKVNVSKTEAKYINRTTSLYVKSGNVTLSGEEALVYVRIRKGNTGGDTARTERQRKVLLSILEEAKESSLTEINNALNALFPYVHTNYSRTQLVKVAAEALTNGWLNYPLTQTAAQKDGMYTSATIRTAWVWVVDLPAAANYLQNELYGQSNIILEEGRATIFDYLPKFNKSSTTNSGGNSGSTTKRSSGTTGSTTTTTSQPRFSLPAKGDNTTTTAAPSTTTTKPTTTTSPPNTNDNIEE